MSHFYLTNIVEALSQIQLTSVDPQIFVEALSQIQLTSIDPQIFLNENNYSSTFIESSYTRLIIDLSLCHKLKCSNPYIFTTSSLSCKPLIFPTEILLFDPTDFIF